MIPSKKEPSRDDESRIRENRPQSRRISQPQIVLTPRDVRIEHKLQRAEELLASLPADDARGRLIQIALLRRDEALLDGILSTLERPDP